MFIRCWCIILFTALTLRSMAQEIYAIDTLYPVHPLDGHLQVLPDTAAAYSIEDILNDSSMAFRPLSSLPKPLNIGTIYWGKMQLKTEVELKGWTLHLEDRFFNSIAWIRGNGKVDIYAYAAGNLLFHKKTGADYPKHEKDIPEKWILNRINFDIPVGQVVTVIMRVEGTSFGFPPFFNASLRKPSHTHYHPLFEFHTSFNIFLFGVAFILFLYHFLQFLYLRQAIFFWFSLWVMLSMMTQAMTTGIETELFIGHFPRGRLLMWILIPNSMLFTFWFFGRSFIKSRERFPRLDKFIVALPLLMVAVVIYTLINVLVGEADIRYTQVGWHYKFIILFALLGLALAVAIALQKDRFARYFGIGAIVGNIFILLGGLWSERLIRMFFDPYAWGMFSQMIAYSFGIAYRQQQLSIRAQNEKLEAQKAKSEMERIKDLDEVKTRFFANISHEFRTPLSLILGPLQQADNTAASSPNAQKNNIVLSSKAFSIVKRNALRLQTLVDQLLDLSRIESGQVYLSLTQGSLVQFIRSVVFSFESMAERQNISLNTSFPKEPDNAFYDRDKLEKIIGNLLSNAFKYTPDSGAVTVIVQHDDSHFTLEISDTGKGIDKEAVKHIFERFYRVEGSEEKGSGIGLALTKELVDAHNGRISVSSHVGKGTSFKVRIPYTLQNLPESILTISGENQEEPKLNERSVFSSENGHFEKELASSAAGISDLPVALVIEDNEDLRSFVSDILLRHYQVLTASDGVQGERMAFEHIPDIIISDVMMPKKDGYELCHTLKTNWKTSHIPVIMLTAKAGHSNKMEGLTQGADAYLTKPFDENELLVRMKNLIDARKKMWEHFKASDLILIDDLDITSVDDQFLQEVVRAIKKNLDNELLSVEDLGREVGFSRSQLNRKLKALTNKTVNQLVVEIRLNEARRMLENKMGSVSEIAYSVGYSNMSYFTKSFKEKFGLLPSKV